MNARGDRYSRRDLACRFARANEDVKCTKRIALTVSSARASARASDRRELVLDRDLKFPRAAQRRKDDRILSDIIRISLEGLLRPRVAGYCRSKHSLELKIRYEASLFLSLSLSLSLYIYLYIYTFFLYTQHIDNIFFYSSSIQTAISLCH